MSTRRIDVRQSAFGRREVESVHHDETVHTPSTRSRDARRGFNVENRADVRPESLAEKSASGSTGYQLVASGESPDGMARASFENPDAALVSMASPISVGESPTETGESPVPPNLLSGSEKDHTLCE